MAILLNLVKYHLEISQFRVMVNECLKVVDLTVIATYNYAKNVCLYCRTEF